MSNLAKHVLIVDDDEGIRRSLARIMRRRGYNVETAGDGDSAVELSKSVRPDLWIIDIRMPGIDGIEMFVRVRANDPQASAIFMTADSPSNRVNDALAVGAHAVFAKPLDIDALVCEIDQLENADSN